MSSILFLADRVSSLKSLATLMVFLLGMGFPFSMTPSVMSSPSKTVIRKCCPVDQVIDAFRMRCRDSGATKWTPRYSTVDEGWSQDEDFEYEVKVQIPKCPTGVHVLPLRELAKHPFITPADFRLIKSGQLLGKHANGDWIDIPEDSCIDGIMNLSQNDEPYSFSGHEMDQAIITCPVALD